MMLKRFLLFSLVVIASLIQNKSYTASYIDLKRDIAIAYNNADFSRAIREYKKLAEGGDIEGHLNLAVALKDLGHYSRAINILKKAYSKFGDDLRILSLLGRLYYLNSQPDEAISVLEMVSMLKPDDLPTYINLGLCYQDKDNDIEAQKYYAKTISLDKNNVVARLYLADLYYHKDKLPEAINEYKAVSLIDASIIKIQKILAQLFFRMGNLEESLKVFRRIRFISPEDKLAEQRINEISSKLGKDYFDREKERLALKREQKKVKVLPFPKIKNMVFVKIGLIRGKNLVEFKCSSPFEIKTKLDQVNIINGLEDRIYTISKNTDGKIVIFEQSKENIIIDEPIAIRPLESEGTITLFDVKFGQGNFWAGQLDMTYRGVIEVSADKSGISVINIVGLEEYLYSVVPSEMPSNWPKEALKAQAVASRTEAMKKLARHKQDGFDFCPEVHCQVYAGVGQETEKTNQAVDETRGIIMTHNGKPIDAVYSSNCGGHTQENIFGEGQNIPYLLAKFDSLEKQTISFPLSPFELEYWLNDPPRGILCDAQGSLRNSNFRWIRIYTAEEMNEMLNKIADFGEVTKIVILKRQKSGHISRVKIIGSNTFYILEKELDIRRAFGNLRSSLFKVEIKYGPNKKPKEFIFYGGGFGHGVGMCQAGAYGLADKGRDYKEILRHYYQKVKFKKIY